MVELIYQFVSIENKYKSKTLIVKDVDTGVREAMNILRRDRIR